MTPQADPRGPFHAHATRRYDYAWRQLADRTGRHLDIGCNRGEFLNALDETTALECLGVDAHAGYLAEARAAYPHLSLAHMHPGPFRLPYADGSIASVSMLDTLEHVRDEGECLAEVSRILQPGGIVIISVPRRHIFTMLDPDNAKYRWPAVHRFVYARRFGEAVYRERFVDLADGLRGDIAAEKTEHTNYRTAWLVAELRRHGLETTDISGANLFWRFFHIPALLLRGRRVRALLERCMYWDGRLFRKANLFITAQKSDRR